MGTRADFYVGRGEQAEWLGSIAWDGNPGAIFDGDFTPAKCATVEQWRGGAWFVVDMDAENCGEPDDDIGPAAVFPNMAERKAMTYGPRSGLIVFGGSS